MDLIGNLALGFDAALAPINLLCVFLGCLLGTLVGVLPGIAPVAMMAMLLPVANALPPLSALILLAGIHCGSRYGGTRHGGSTAALGLFLAACAGMLVLVALAPALSALALQFGPAESFALMLLGLTGAVVLASAALLKALAMVLLGLLLGLVGTDGYSGVVRFALEIPELSNGIGLVAIAMGIFGFGEIISNLARTLPVRRVSQARGPVLWRGGKGLVLGVAAPDAAHHAGTHTAFIVLLALGIAPNAAMALMLGALNLHEIRPGPQLLGSNPVLFWGLIASMWLGNLMLLVLNLPMARIGMRLLSLPYRWVYPAVVLLCAMGIYTTHYGSFGIGLVAVFGLVGYVFYQLDMPPVPLLLGFVLGPAMESSVRNALWLSNGDWNVLVRSPLSVGLLLAALCLLVLVFLPVVQAWRKAALSEREVQDEGG